MLVQRRRCFSGIIPLLGRCVVFAVYLDGHDVFGWYLTIVASHPTVVDTLFFLI